MSKAGRECGNQPPRLEHQRACHDFPVDVEQKVDLVQQLATACAADPKNRPSEKAPVRERWPGRRADPVVLRGCILSLNEGTRQLKKTNIV